MENLMDLLENEQENKEDSGFVIDTPAKADWAVKTIKEAKERYNLYMEALDEHKREIKEKEVWAQQNYEKETQYLFGLLSEYMETLPCKHRKTQKSFTFPSGKVIKKAPKYFLDYDEDKLLEAYANTDFVETTKKLKWGKLKQIFTVADEKIIDTETGEIVEGVYIQQIPEKIDIK